MTHRFSTLTNKLPSLKALALCSLAFGCDSGLVVSEEADDSAGGQAGTDTEEPAGIGASPTIPDAIEDPGYPWGCGGTSTTDDSTTDDGSIGEDWDVSSNTFGELVGTEWAGHIDHGPTMRLTIDDAASARVVFGDIDQYAPPVDANLGWACDASLSDGRGCTSFPHAGVTYTVGLATLQGERLQFSLHPMEPWDDWCGLQERLWLPGSVCEFTVEDRSQAIDYQACAYLGPDGTEYEQLDCGWLDLAAGLTCECDLDGCSADMDHWGATPFDLSLSDDGLSLTGSYLEGDAHPLTLTRVSSD